MIYFRVHIADLIHKKNVAERVYKSVVNWTERREGESVFFSLMNLLH